MSLAEAASSGPTIPKRQPGKIDAWLAGLPESEREAALRILRDPQWPHEQIVSLFLEHGLDVTGVSILRYRRKLDRDPR